MKFDLFFLMNCKKKSPNSVQFGFELYGILPPPWDWYLFLSHEQGIFIITMVLVSGNKLCKKIIQLYFYRKLSKKKLMERILTSVSTFQNEISHFMSEFRHCVYFKRISNSNLLWSIPARARIIWNLNYLQQPLSTTI